MQKSELVSKIEVTVSLSKNAVNWIYEIRDAGGLTLEDYAHLAGTNDNRALAYKLVDKRTAKSFADKIRKSDMVSALEYVEWELGEFDKLISLGLERLENKWKAEQFGA